MIKSSKELESLLSQGNHKLTSFSRNNFTSKTSSSTLKPRSEVVQRSVCDTEDLTMTRFKVLEQAPEIIQSFIDIRNQLIDGGHYSESSFFIKVIDNRLKDFLSNED